MAARTTLALALALRATGRAAPPVAFTVSTLIGPPEIVGGPVSNMFDNPLLALKRPSDGATISLTSNSDTYLWSAGPNVTAQLTPPPAVGGLTSDADPNSTAHCGRWANAGMPLGDTIVVWHHQEWRCDYARAGYTNKSVGYAVSVNGGLNFTTWQAQVIASGNTTDVHQTGQGDHGVVRWADPATGEEFLYLLFLDWDGQSASGRNATTVGVARSRVADGGVPGSWLKRCGGAWACPGVGGAADALQGIAGTAVVAVPAAQALLTVGVTLSASLDASWSGDAVNWAPAAAGPIFASSGSSWDRNANATELYAYPTVVGLYGNDAGAPANASFVYATYLTPGTGFNARWLMRRPLRMLQRGPGGGGNASLPPAALETLSLWSAGTGDSGGSRSWATTGPVVPYAGYTPRVATLALLATSAAPGYGANLTELHECALPLPAGSWAPGNQSYTAALTLPNECGAGAFAGGKPLRLAGFVGATSADAAALGWASVQVLGQPDAPLLGSQPGALWRCRGPAASPGAPPDFSVSFGQASCASAGAGYVADRLLGYALAPVPGLW